MVVRAIIKEDRYGNKVYICPLCGHVFYSPKQFQKHLMRSHLHKKHRKRRIEKKIEKRGYIRRLSFGRPKAPKIEEKVEKVVEAKQIKPEVKPEPKVEEPKKEIKKEADEELLKAVEKFIENRAKGKKKKSIRFKITTLARELNIDVEKAREIISKVPNATIKGDRVTVKLE